jgi:peptidoglycan/xylan/chitin deacetylase (PgdA/CDA1 family)
MTADGAARRGGGDVLVLCYHGISSIWPEEVALSADRLRSQIRALLRSGWRPTTFTEAVLAPSPHRTIAVTFDDALRSVHRLAFPVLREIGVPATVFAPTSLVGSGRPFAWPHIDRWLGTEHEAELEGMSWRELGELRDAGWEIASHSATHPRLTDLDDNTLESELADSKRAIEDRLGAPCRSIAYPYAAVDDRVVSAARRAGYEAGAAVLPIHPGGDAMRFPRVPMLSSESPVMHRLHTTRSMRRLQTTRPWVALRRVAAEARQS